ncbi:MAG TPA: hypothetical protein PK926_12695 [Spirochaetota bacterium]|nr:hypothetical protein [Spirochaetota bacterium]HPI91048.1 hypothetical protein [Spirochaetota bacterium]HPR49084.1 hypothetical protein [Spirochaetota bacterium]
MTGQKKIIVFSCIFSALLCANLVQGAEPAPQESPSTAAQIKSILSAEDKNITGAIELAKTIPVFSAEGKIHSVLIDYLLRLDITSNGYHDFVITALRSGPVLKNDHEAFLLLDLIRYISSDGVDAAEWKAALPALVRCKKTEYTSSLLSELFSPHRGEKISTREKIKRIDEYFTEAARIARNNRVQETCFEEMIQALVYSPIEAYDSRAALHCFNKHFILVPDNHKKSHYPALKKMYLDENIPASRKAVLKIICRDIINDKTGRKQEILDFLFLFRRGDTDRKDEPEPEHPPLSDLKTVFALSGPAIQKIFTALDTGEEKHEAAVFCLETGFSCPGVIPGEAEILSLLQSDNEDDNLDGIGFITAARKASPEIESALGSLMKQKDQQQGTSPAAVLEQGIRCLAAINTDNKKSMDLLVGLLGSTHQGICDRAADALVSLGAKTVPSLVENINTKNDFSALMAIMVLKKAAPSSRYLASLLKNKAASCKNPRIADEALTSFKKKQ